MKVGPCPVFALMVTLMLSVPSLLSAQTQFPWRSEVDPTRCGPDRDLGIQAVERVINSVDSGEGGNYWAYDHYIRRFQVWARPDGTFCALVSYHGRFDGDGGQVSPGATGVLSGAEDGPFEGGYRAIIEGVLLDDPFWPDSGFVGTTDHDCDISGDCPGKVDWVQQYFESDAVFEYEWWGWIYHGGDYGTWINSSDGNQGDIVDE